MDLFEILQNLYKEYHRKGKNGKRKRSGNICRGSGSRRGGIRMLINDGWSILGYQRQRQAISEEKVSELTKIIINKFAEEHLTKGEACAVLKIVEQSLDECSIVESVT